MSQIPSTTTAPAPIIDGFTIHSIRVNGSDERWKTIDRRQYGYCNSGATVDDFVVDPRDRLVRYLFLWNGYDHLLNWAIEETARRYLIRPDRAVTETILDLPMAWNAGTIAGLCGAIRSSTNGDVVGEIMGGPVCRGIEFTNLRCLCSPGTRYIAVVSEEIIE